MRTLGDSSLKLRPMEQGGVAVGLCGLCDIAAAPLKSNSFPRPPQPVAVVVTLVHLMRAPVETFCLLLEQNIVGALGNPAYSSTLNAAAHKSWKKQNLHFALSQRTTQLPSEKFLKKSLKVRIWDLASICNFSELIGTNFFLGRPGLACWAAHNCLVGTKKLLPAMYATGYNFRCQHSTTVTKGRS